MICLYTKEPFIFIIRGLILKYRDTKTGLTTPRMHSHRSPTPTNNNISWRPWKRKHSDKYSTGKLQIPLPIPHPVHIAIEIYNRDSEQPISLDSELCWDILRAVEDCQANDVEVSSCHFYPHFFFVIN